MKKYNLSLVIPAYTNHRNVFRFITHLNDEKIKLNNIFVISDKIDINQPGHDLNSIIESYRYKNALSHINGVTNISKLFHGGHAGIVNYIYDLKLNDDENLIIMEDDLFAASEFFEQCEEFFSEWYSVTTPLFVGYSKTNSTEEKFFKTYNMLYLWGFALKFSDLKSIIKYHHSVRKFDGEQKRGIIESVLNFTYPCKYFEKYKKKLMDVIQNGFTQNTNESADLYFMFYFLQNRLAVIKNTKSYVQSDKPSCVDCGLNEVEADIKSLLDSYVE